MSLHLVVSFIRRLDSPGNMVPSPKVCAAGVFEKSRLGRGLPGAARYLGRVEETRPGVVFIASLTATALCMRSIHPVDGLKGRATFVWHDVRSSVSAKRSPSFPPYCSIMSLRHQVQVYRVSLHRR